MQKNFCLQHKVFKHRGLVVGNRFGIFFDRLPTGVQRGGKAVGDGAIAVGINVPFEQLQPLLVSFFVGINLSCGVQAIARF